MGRKGKERRERVWVWVFGSNRKERREEESELGRMML